MKTHIIILALAFYSTFSFSQNSERKKLKEWIEKNNIVFNSPTCPNGFEHFLNCNDIHAYRKIIGDTIIIYSQGGSIAENIETLNESIKNSRFNVYRYPSYTQDNGTIVVHEMRKWIFLSKNDSLYLLDQYDDKKSNETSKILDTFLNGKISESEFNKQIKEIENTDFGYIPKFKLIYFKGIFKDSNEYRFDKKQNFREESVTLLNTWKINNMRYYKINLKTWTAGTYIVSEDLSFINTEICEK